MGTNKHIAAVIFCFAVGCGGDDGSNNPDAAGGGNDASPTADADTTDAAPTVGTCGVIVDFGRLDATDLQVAFSRPDGSLLGGEVTDTAGAAARTDCVVGTSITIGVRRQDGDGTLFVTYTLMAVDPGVTARFGIPAAPPTPLVTDGLTVNTLAAPGGTTSTSVGLGCSTLPGANAGGTVTFGALPPRCVGNDGSTMNLLAIANAGNAANAFTWVTDITPVPGATTAVGTIPKKWAGAATASSTVTGIPGSVSTTAHELSFFRNGIEYYSVVGNADVTADSSATDLVGVSNGFATERYLRTVLNFAAGQNTAIRTSVQELAAHTQPFIGYLPRLSGVLVSSADPVRPSLSWAADGDLTGADGGALVSTRLDGLDRHIVMIVFPTTNTGPIQFPLLPETMADFRPKAGGTYLEAGGYFVDAENRAYIDLLTSGHFGSGSISSPSTSFEIPGATVRTTTKLAQLFSPQ